ANLAARRLGVRIMEGYGATECSPCVSLNTPMEAKYGSAGKLLPHIEYKLEPVEGVSETGDGEHPTTTQQNVPGTGRLLVRGPNVMKGYVNPDAHSEFNALGGGDDTGDIASGDAARF